MALKHKRVVFAPTDGALYLCERSDEWQRRGIKWTDAIGLDVIYTLQFRKMSVRAVDAQLLGEDAEQISLKVAIQHPPKITTNLTVTIDGKNYDITKADESGRLTYLYLTELASVGQCDLISVKTTYDKVGIKKTTESRLKVWMRGASHSISAVQHGALDALDVTLRAVDWQGERLLEVNGTRYRVQKAIGKGDWVTLQCSEGVADVK